MLALKVALDSMEDIGGRADKEDEEAVLTDVVDGTLDVGKEKVNDVKKTGADRRESRMRLRSGYASVEGGYRVEERCHDLKKKMGDN